ncbi:hypothetical protein ACFWHL_40490 [Streptomyces massasporeus]
MPGSLVGVRRAVCPFPRRPFAALAAAPPRTPFLGLPSWPERQAVARALRTETVGGLVLLTAAVVTVYRRLYEEENLDEDADGIPDIYQRADASGA